MVCAEALIEFEMQLMLELVPEGLLPRYLYRTLHLGAVACWEQSAWRGQQMKDSSAPDPASYPCAYLARRPACRALLPAWLA
jgi:hypothetical protein